MKISGSCRTWADAYSFVVIPEDVEISPELEAELEARLVEFEENPEAGFSWAQVEARLTDGSWRSV